MGGGVGDYKGKRVRGGLGMGMLVGVGEVEVTSLSEEADLAVESVDEGPLREGQRSSADGLQHGYE